MSFYAQSLNTWNNMCYSNLLTIVVISWIRLPIAYGFESHHHPCHKDSLEDNPCFSYSIKQVKMAEETVKRVTGLNPLFQSMSEITMGMPSFDISSETSADAAVPVQDDLKPQHYYHNAPSSSQASVQDHRIQNGVVEIQNVQPNAAEPNAAGVGANKMGRTVSMQRVASLEHLQKRIRGASGSSETQGNGEP